MVKQPHKALRDEAELRAFYESVGLSPEIIELAIIARRQKPLPLAKPPKEKKRTPAPGKTPPRA